MSPGDIAVAACDWDLAYMGVYLRLEICNRSPYLVRKAQIRVDGRGSTVQRVVRSEVLTVGPLFPGVHVHEEVGLGAPEGISGVSFDTVAVRAVRLTAPSEMRPAAEYPGLTAEVVDVSVDEEAPDLRSPDDGTPGDRPTAVATVIRIRVRNAGPSTVERVQLRLGYLGTDDEENEASPVLPLTRVASWILDMPRAGWNPYRLPAPPDAVCEPADPLRPGEAHELTLVHYHGGPHGWAGCPGSISVDVCGVRTRSATLNTV